MIAAFTFAQGAWLSAGWLAVGGLTASWLSREGHPAAASAAAVLAWPFFLPLVARAVEHHPPPTGTSPNADRIHKALDAVLATLTQHGEVEQHAEVSALRTALLAADQRLAWVDQILAEHHRLCSEDDGEAVRTLRAARQRASTELDDVLREILQLRLQLGLHALRGDTAPIGRTLSELRARVATLEELATLAPPTKEPRRRP